MNVEKHLGAEILENALNSNVRLFESNNELTDENIEELNELFKD